MQINDIIEAWNKQADELNRWDNLGADEMVEFTLRHIECTKESAMCSVCAGQGKPVSGKKCICGGAGTQTAEMQGLRNYIFSLEPERGRLLVLAIKHCNTGHRDWNELVEIAKKARQ